MPDTAQAQISVALLDRDFREVQRRDHSYRSNLNWHFMPGDTGRYYLQANLYLKGEVLESDTAVVQVLFYDPETRYRGCDVPALKSLSGNHGGIYLHISQFDSLIKVLPIEKERHPQTSVLQARRAYAGILLLLILLCAEWIIRKRYGSV